MMTGWNGLRLKFQINCLDKFFKYIKRVEVSIWYYSSEFYLRVFRDGSGSELHKISGEDPTSDIKISFFKEADSLKKITDAIYYISKYMLYHNNN